MQEGFFLIIKNNKDKLLIKRFQKNEAAEKGEDDGSSSTFISAKGETLEESSCVDHWYSDCLIGSDCNGVIYVYDKGTSQNRGRNQSFWFK